jgi:hypothetical protein
MLAARVVGLGRHLAARLHAQPLRAALDVGLRELRHRAGERLPGEGIELEIDLLPTAMNSTSDWSTTITASNFSGSPTMQSTVPSVNVAPRFFSLSALPLHEGSRPEPSFGGATPPPAARSRPAGPRARARAGPSASFPAAPRRS